MYYARVCTLEEASGVDFMSYLEERGIICIYTYIFFLTLFQVQDFWTARGHGVLPFFPVSSPQSITRSGFDTTPETRRRESIFLSLLQAILPRTSFSGSKCC